MRLGLIACAFLFATVLHGTAKAAAQSGITEQSPNGVTCASDDGRRHYCAVDTRGGVQLLRQRSGSPCVQGQTWGYDRRGVWVDRGCRADFSLSRAGFRPPSNGSGFRPQPPFNGGGNGGQIIQCSSNDGKRNYCQANTRRGVTMVQQRSGSPCVQNQTWGYSQNQIWVDRGCRADFSLGR